MFNLRFSPPEVCSSSWRVLAVAAIIGVLAVGVIIGMGLAFVATDVLSIPVHNLVRQ